MTAGGLGTGKGVKSMAKDKGSYNNNNVSIKKKRSYVLMQTRNP